MTLDFSCVKQDDTSPLVIQITCSYSATVPYNREGSSLPPILFLLSFYFSFNGRRASTTVEILYHAYKSFFEVTLNAKVPGLHWLEL